MLVKVIIGVPAKCHLGCSQNAVCGLNLWDEKRVKRRVILISIQIFVVAIAITLTATTYAWFVSQTKVSVTPTTITASAAANTVINSEEEIEHDPYRGETGQGYAGDGAEGVDAPYTVEKKLTITFNPLGEESAMTAKILSMQVTRANGDVVSSEGAEATPEILDHFTWRIEIDGLEYGPDGDGFLCREDEGEILYYAVPESATVELIFKLIFLDETSYAHWLNGEYDDIEPFEYCGYENMKAVFTCRFEVGIAAHAVAGGGNGDGGAGE